MGDQMSKPPKKKSVTTPYLTAQEAAAYLRLKRSTIDHYRCSGAGPKYRKHGGRIAYHIDDLDAWSKSKSYNNTATRTGS